MSTHVHRAHSKFSASGSERWLNCPASVSLEAKSPKKPDSPWSLEGTKAHEVLEVLFKIFTIDNFKPFRPAYVKSNDEMVTHALTMIKRVFGIRKDLKASELLIEQRVYNSEIHPEMFGTVDAAIIELGGTLHVLDYKYGKGHVVKAEGNTQMIQYALGLAEKYEWNFKRVVVHIMQPRAGKNWHTYWEMPIEKLKSYKELWKKGVARVESSTAKTFAGSWCHWCGAKAICPSMTEKGMKKVLNMFESEPLPPMKGNNHGKQEESEKEKGYKKSNKKGSQKENPFLKEEKEEVQEDFY